MSDEKTPVQIENETPANHEITPMHSLREEIDRVFERFGVHLPKLWDPFKELSPWIRSSGEALPRVDVSETDDGYEISAELPGMDRGDIEVTMTDGKLVVKGEKRQEKETKDKDYHLRERSYGEFRRVLAMPSGVDEEKVKARFKKGVLTLSLPKTEEAKQKQRTIKVTGA